MIGSRSRQMIVPRAIYFFYFAGMACWMPFMAIYFQNLDLSGSQIGLLVALPSIITWLAAPSWGALADVTRKHKHILLLSIAGTMLSVFGLSQAHQFAWLLVWVILYSLFLAPIMSLVDNSVMELLGERGSAYGQQRVWGSYGWGLGGLVIGSMINQWGISIIFFAFIGLFVCAFVFTLGFDVRPVSIRIQFRGSLRRLFSNRQWLVFLFVVFIIAAGTSMLANYYFVFLESLNTSGTLMGLALALSVMSEIPVMLFSDRILVRYNVRWLLIMGFGLLVFRTLAASLATLPWQGVALHFFQGITFSLVWLAGVKYAAEIAPPGMGATAQGIFGGVYQGLGYGIGAFLGGWLYGLIGIRAMYRWDALAMGLAAAAFILWNSRNQAAIAPVVGT